MSNSDEPRSVRVDPDLWKTAMELARSNGENLSVVIRRALLAYVKRGQK